MAWFIVGSIVTRVLILILFILIVMRIAAAIGDRSRRNKRRHAEETLRRRFAEGEIGEEEYRERFAVLCEDQTK